MENDHLAPFSLFCLAIFKRERRWKGRKLEKKLKRKGRQGSERGRKNLKGREENNKGRNKEKKE